MNTSCGMQGQSCSRISPTASRSRLLFRFTPTLRKGLVLSRYRAACPESCHNQHNGAPPDATYRAKQAFLAAILSIAAAISNPLTAEARKAEPPPPPPTAYDELQKIISGRSGNTGSLLESFKKTVTAPVTGIVEAVQPSLSSTPAAVQPKSAANVPKQANAAVQEVQKGADQAVEVSPSLDSSQPLLAAIAAAVIGFGGYKVFTGRQGNIASKPGRAVRGAKQQVQRQAGTRKIGTAVKQAPKKAARPLQNALQSSKGKAKQASKKAGGLFGIKTALSKQAPAKEGRIFGIKASSPKKAAKKIAPAATKKIQKTASKAIGTQRAGTKRIGGTKRSGGTSKIGGSKQASRRLQLDEDTSSTLGAAGVVGLGLAVAAFVGFNLATSEDTATAQEAAKDAVSKITDIPAAVSGSSKASGGPQDFAANAQKAAPDVQTPDVKAPVEQAQKKVENVPDVVASVAEKASDDFQSNAPSSPAEAAKEASEPVAKVAEKAVEAPSPGKVAEVPAPDPLGPKSDAAQASKQIAETPKQVVETTKQEAPQAVAEVARAAPESLAPKLPQESLEKPTAGSRAPDTTLLRKGAVENASRETAAQTIGQSGDQPKPSAAFEAAAKKLSSGKSGAELFETTRTQELKKLEAAELKAGQKAIGKAGDTKSPSKAPAAAAKATGQAAKAGGSSSGLILGGLAAAAVVGVAVAAPKDKAGEAVSDAASVAKETAESTRNQAQSAAGNSSQGGSTGGGEADVKDDIAARKQDAKQWISDWREATGGK